MTTKYQVWGRRQIEVNTDPLRRCYNGCHFSSEMVWTEWAYLATYSERSDAEESNALFKSINPTHEYKIEEVEA